jgi:hypothetical protein
MCYPILPFLFPSLNNRGADTEQRKPKLGCQYVIQKVVVKKERKLNQAYLPPHISKSFAQQGLHKHVSMF